MCNESLGPAAARYAEDVVSLHRKLSFRGLTAELSEPDLVHHEVRGDGLVALAVRTRDLPHRYLLGLQGFRLSQYLQLGWICEETIYSSAMFAEPLHGASPDDVHVMCLDGRGTILGYLCLTASHDEEPKEVLDPTRAPFPVEEAHGINLFDHVECLPGTTTDQVRELKRFVHARSLTDRGQRLRVTMELLYGMGRVIAGMRPGIRTLVGDLEEHVALRHLMLAGLDVHLVDGTAPELERRDLLHHMYVVRGAVKPFVAHLPADEVIAEKVAMLESTLVSEDLFDAAAQLRNQQSSQLLRVAG
jgi:hypothetical protein